MVKTWEIDAHHPLFEQRLESLPPEAVDRIASLLQVIRESPNRVPVLNAEGVRMVKTGDAWTHPNGVVVPPMRVFFRLTPDDVVELLWADPDVGS